MPDKIKKKCNGRWHHAFELGETLAFVKSRGYRVCLSKSQLQTVEEKLTKRLGKISYKKLLRRSC
jgi:hypothetical protein